MFSSVTEFEEVWAQETQGTLKLLEALTDESLARPQSPHHRPLGHVAWHVVTAIPEMVGRMGLKASGPGEHDPVPRQARAIADGYRQLSQSLLAEIKANWTDATLQVEDDMYGERWKRGMTLSALVAHEIHHRGQMTILMRQAGLKVPGVYGPAREEWAAMGMKPPAI